MTTSRSRHLVDPGIVGFVDLFPKLVLSDESLAQMRGAGLSAPTDPAAMEATDLAWRTISGPDGAPDLQIMIITPRTGSGPRPCIFHVHGGGFVAGTAEQFEGLLRPLAAELDCIVTSVNYRLAPETAFPGPLEDCYAALAWVFKNAGDLGVDASRIAVKGESAGGGLAAGLALLARDRGEYALMFQSLTYPMLDDRTCVADPHPYAGEFLWTAPHNAYGWRAYLGVEPGSDGVSPYAAPARAENLAGLPPTYICTASLDLFIDENIEYARRLIRAGTPCELHVFPGGYHGFDMAPGVAISQAAQRDTVEALRRALRPA